LIFLENIHPCLIVEASGQSIHNSAVCRGVKEKTCDFVFLHKIEIDFVNPRIEQTLGKTMIAGNSNIINCSVHHYYCSESSLEPNSSNFFFTL